MSLSQVSEIELRDDGSIALTIEVFGFEAGTPVEISGNATQANGAIATFYDIQNLPPASPGGGSFLTVIAIPSTEIRGGGRDHGRRTGREDLGHRIVRRPG